MPKDYSRVDQYPQNVDAVGVIVRLLDGLGFRFYWATQGLREEDYFLAPQEGANTLGWMVQHVWGLMNWVHLRAIGSGFMPRPSIPEQRDQALEIISAIQDHIAQLSSDELAKIQIEGRPFWHLINGPLSDALTHVGQINLARRLLGIPSPPARVFTCEPPAAD